MTSVDGSAIRRWWRPRFSVRSLAIVVTLVSAYFGAWEATKNAASSRSLAAPMPFVFVEVIRGNAIGSRTYNILPVKKRYHLWFFGPTFKLTEWQ